MSEFALQLINNVLAAALIFLAGLFWPIIPKSYRQLLLRRFWGKGVLGEEFVICYGALIDPRPRRKPDGEINFRYHKRYHDDREHDLVGPFSNIIGASEVRTASYLLNAISAYRKTPVPVVSDSSAFGDLRRAFVALGSPSSNEITDLVLREPNNNFLDFGQEDKTAFIIDKKTGKQFEGFREPVRKDYGLILRIPNQRFAGHFFFVCAGLGEWGTSGAAWYLSTKWRELQAEFGDAFGVVVEVELRSDGSARRVFPED